MKSFLLPTALLLGILLAVRLAAAPQSQDPRYEILLRGAVQTPHWDTIQLEDEVAAMVLRVPPEKRFVLTDLWLLSNERLPVPVSEGDSMWMECVADGRRKVVFDSPVSELERPLRWETGVVFGPGREMWLRYDIAGETRRPRRVHFSGYFEDVEPLRIVGEVEPR